MMEDRLGVSVKQITASEDGNPALDRCEAYEPKVSAEREAKYLAIAKGTSNPITAFISSMYPSREWEEKWFRDHFARVEGDAHLVKLIDIQKYDRGAAATGAHLAQRRYEKEVEPRRGDARRYLWEYSR